MKRTQGTADRANSGKRKLPHGVIEHPPGSGIYCAQYFCAGCPRHAPGTPRARRRHRERAGTISLARALYQKRKTEIREHRFFPTAQPADVWDPLFAGFRDGKLTGYVADYLARNGSTLVDLDGAQRYARYFAEAPETKGKTMRALTPQDAQKYRERRRREGAPGARRRCQPAAASTINKELSFGRAVFYDWIAACEDRGVPAKPNPFRQRRRDHSDRKLFQPEPAGRTRYLSDREESRLREAIGSEHWPKVLMAIHSGLDRGAQFGLRWSDVDLRTRTIHAERRKGRRSGPVPVTIPINDDLLDVLRALPSRGRSAWLFPNDPNDDNAGPLDADDFDRLVWQPALVRAGLTKVTETRETKQVRAQLWRGAKQVPGWRTVEKVHRQIVRTFRWKDLRHTFATRLRMTGSDTGTIRDLLGHTSDRMTKRYAHAATSHLHDAVQRLNRGNESATRSATSADTPKNAPRKVAES